MKFKEKFLDKNLDELFIGQDSLQIFKAEKPEHWQTLASRGHSKMILPAMQPSSVGP